MEIFPYGEMECTYLKKKDKRLGAAIDAIGKIERAVTPDLFEALVNSIVGQQISTKALNTVWGRISNALCAITPETVLAPSVNEWQAFGITFKKAGYIRGIAEAVVTGAFDLEKIAQMPDDAAIAALSGLNGVGVWTAEMLLLFSLLRPNVFSYGDLAIHRGLKTLYHHKEISKPLFERYRRRYAPYGSVASLYLWAIAAGALDDA